ncbi:hypothetical protein YC2023_004851 [Brassica napus]
MPTNTKAATTSPPAHSSCLIKIAHMPNVNMPMLFVDLLVPVKRTTAAGKSFSYPRGQVQRVSNPLQPNSSSHISPTDDLAAVKLVVDLTGFGLGDVVHSESEAEIG